MKNGIKLRKIINLKNTRVSRWKSKLNFKMIDDKIIGLWWYWKGTHFIFCIFNYSTYIWCIHRTQEIEIHMLHLEIYHPVYNPSPSVTTRRKLKIFWGKPAKNRKPAILHPQTTPSFYPHRNMSMLGIHPQCLYFPNITAKLSDEKCTSFFPPCSAHSLRRVILSPTNTLVFCKCSTFSRGIKSFTMTHVQFFSDSPSISGSLFLPKPNNFMEDRKCLYTSGPLHIHQLEPMF